MAMHNGSLVSYYDSSDEDEDGTSGGGDSRDAKLPISHVSEEPYGLRITEEDIEIVREKPIELKIDDDSYIMQTEPLTQEEIERDLRENSVDLSKPQNVHIIHTKVENFTPPGEYEKSFQNHTKPSPPPRSSSLVASESDSDGDDGDDKSNKRRKTTTTTTNTTRISTTTTAMTQGVPPRPTTEPDLNITEKILKYYNMKQQGIHLNESLRESHSFKNPSILEKLIQFCNIKEYDSNIKLSDYNPNRFSAEEDYRTLDKNQRKADEMREFNRRQNKSNNIQFVSPQQNSANQNTNKNFNNNNSNKYKQGAGMKTAPPQPSQVKQKGAVISSSPSVASSTTNKKRDLEAMTQSHIDLVSKRFRTNIN